VDATVYALRLETLEPIRAPETFAPDELVLVVLPEFRSVVLTEIGRAAEWAELVADASESGLA
jgi:hypothetical protein